MWSNLVHGKYDSEFDESDSSEEGEKCIDSWSLQTAYFRHDILKLIDNIFQKDSSLEKIKIFGALS